MSEHKRSTFKLSKGGTTFMKKDGTPDTVRQKKHDDDIEKEIAANKAKADAPKQDKP